MNVFNRILIYLVIIIFIFKYLYHNIKPDNNENYYYNELFTSDMQNEAYICKTNNDIFDIFYIQIHDLLYYDSLLSKYIFDKINEYVIIKNQQKKYNKKNENRNQKKNINFLIIWPENDKFIKLFNYYKFTNDIDYNKYEINKTIAVQNEFLISLYKKHCNCETNIYDITNAFTFEKKSFTHIILNNFNIYKLSFNEQIKFINAISQWCTCGGYIFIYLLDETIFNNDDNNPLLNASNKLNKKNGNLNTHNYDINTIMRRTNIEAKLKNISIKEEIKLRKDNKRKIYEYCLNITPLNNLVKYFLKNNFAIIEKYPLNEIDIQYDKHYLYVFKKDLTNTCFTEY